MDRRRKRQEEHDRARAFASYALTFVVLLPILFVILVLLLFGGAATLRVGSLMLSLAATFLVAACFFIRQINRGDY